MSRRLSWGVVGAVLSVVAMAGAQGTDDIKPAQPKPPKTGPTQPAKPPRRDPPPAATPSATVPVPAVPDPKQLCEAAGGEWRDSTCDMNRKWCTDAGNQWEEATRKCRGKVVCRPETHEENGSCVADAPSKPAAPAATEAPSSPEPLPPPVAQAPAGSREEQRGSGVWRPLAIWGGLGLLAVGAGTGVWALSKKSSLDEQCEDKSCYESARSDWDGARTIAGVSTGTFVVGGVLLGLGLFVLSDGEDDGSLGREAVTSPVLRDVSVGAMGDGAMVQSRWAF